MHTLAAIIMLALAIDAAIGFMIGRRRGDGLLGLWLGLVFGPIGWVMIHYWPGEDDTEFRRLSSE
jgi:hypothetical protein